MSNLGAAAFWSYAHDDNELDGGRIVSLAENICKEFALVTGESLTLFVDRTGISWGDEWKRRIDSALSETTFFIPIITPRYFARPECRRELLEFSAQARSLGVSELILPIQYAKVIDFSEQNPDEAVALVARMQYVDWMKLRLADDLSSDYRVAINTLAMRLADVANKVAEMQLSDELQEAGKSPDDEPGLGDLFEQINVILPEWVEALESRQVNSAQLQAIDSVYRDRIEKADRSGPPSARFALLQRRAVDELPLAEQALRLSQIYTTKTIELDPLVLAVARIGAAHPQEKELFAGLHAAVVMAKNNIELNKVLDKDPSLISGSERASREAHGSRVMRNLSRAWIAYERSVVETNQIFEKWLAELGWLE
jgi:hypothetical protein